MSMIEIRIPDIGDFKDVPIIEVHVKPGDKVAVEDPLLTLESDKATLEVPCPQAGTIGEVKVKSGDKVSEGDLIVMLEAEGGAAIPPKEKVTEDAAPSAGNGQAGYGSPAGAYESIEVKVPDIGDFKGVPVIEILVKEGDTISAEDPLLTLESDKATMEIPSPAAGTVGAIRIKVGDKVSQGDTIMTLQTQAAAKPNGAAATMPPPTPASAPAGKPASTVAGDIHAEVLVLGAGPGGYTAAFRAADLGKQVVLIERWPTLGGVCLNVGCIPSKALLHAAKVIDETQDMGNHGIRFTDPTIDLDALRSWKDGVVKKLTGGLTGLAKQRKVNVVSGFGRFISLNQVEVEQADGSKKVVTFDQAIIAAGSEPVKLPFIPHDDPRVIDSTGALELGGIPKRLLVLGGGIIGLEMATVYHSLGSKVTIVELMDQIIPGADKDIVTPLMKRIQKKYENIHLKTKVTKVEATEAGSGRPFRGRQGAGNRHLRPHPGRGRAAAERADHRGGERGRRGGRARLHPGGQADADQRGAHLRDRRRGRPADAGAQGGPRGPGRGGSRRRQEQLLRRQGDPVGRLYRSGSRVGRSDRERAEGEGRQVRQGGVPLGRQRPVAVAGPRRGHHQDPVRRDDRPYPRLRHRRSQRRRPDRGSGAGDRDGRRRRRHRPDHPPAPDPVRNDGHGGGSLRGHHHRPLHAEA